MQHHRGDRIGVASLSKGVLVDGQPGCCSLFTIKESDKMLTDTRSHAESRKAGGWGIGAAFLSRLGSYFMVMYPSTTPSYLRILLR